MIVFLSALEFWHWWIAAVLLIILEVLAPGAFFLWMGIAAGIVGTILLVAPSVTWEAQLFVFTVLSVVSVIAWRFYLKKNPIQTDAPTLNRRGEQYVGRVFTLSEAIVNGVGKIKVDDTLWKVNGKDTVAGKSVRVTAVDGVVLQVENADG
jgi:membrane protein implicated in regulation of membrane protease activity